MESEGFQKQMFSTIRKDKIFNVRKVAYKQFYNQKNLKNNVFPLQKKQAPILPSTIQPSKKANEYNYQIAIISSNAYKELNKKYQMLKQDQNAERKRRLQKFKQKQEQLNKYRIERQRLQNEKEKLIQKRDEIKTKIEQIRQKNEVLRAQQMQRDEEYRLMNMQYFRNMIIGIHYQNGIQLDPDNMTYQQLLQLQQNMGNVSKGFTQAQYEKLEKIQVKTTSEDYLCSICYYNVKQGQIINKLTCKHIFHGECIREWLLKQRICPLCKQQIYLQDKIKSGKQILQKNA